MNGGTRAGVRRAGNAVLGRLAAARAAFAYLTQGIEGVNRTLRHTTKPGVIPVLRMFGARVGDGCDIEAPLTIHNASRRYDNLSVGAGCHLGKDVFLDLAEAVAIGDRATVSMRAMILTHTDAGRSPLAAGALPASRKPVRIGAGAYIGAGAIVLPGADVGENAIVGAGAIVTHPVPPLSVVAGSPARTLRQISAAQIVS